MKAISIEQYLNSSRRVENAAPARLSVLFPKATKSAPVDIEALTQDAYQRGRQDGLLDAQMEGAIAEARAAAEKEKLAEEERKSFRSREFGELAVHITQGLTQIESDIAAIVARILESVILREKAAQISDALSVALKNILATDCPPVLTISGPESELTVLRDRLASYPVSFDLRVEDGGDIKVQAQSTLIKTQLGAWESLIGGIFT